MIVFRGFWGARGRSQGGFSLVEMLVSLGLLAGILAVVFVFLDRTRRILETESGDLESRHAARVALDEMAYHIQQAGFGIARPDPYNAGSWQADLIYADTHTLAFNADIDPELGPLDATRTIPLPDGSAYVGEGPSSTHVGAESYVYTLDADGDGKVTEEDRFVGAGDHHPALETANPLDYALYRWVHGYDGAEYQVYPDPITAYLFTNATGDERYPDESSPLPLFTYWLSEDLSGDGILDAHECVVAPCPPSSERQPRLYRWGDGDFDGRFSEEEKAALRLLPVGSPDWAPNPRTTEGAFFATQLVTDALPGDPELRVTNAERFGPGDLVAIDGTPPATASVAAIDASAGTIVLGTGLTGFHAAGSTVRIHPRTLVRAVRTVDVHFSAITPRRDHDAASGAAAIGRAGRVGTRGLDYRVRPFARSLELVNQQVRAAARASTAGPGASDSTCPNVFVGLIDGEEATSVDVFVPRDEPVPLAFVMRDLGGNPMVDYTVKLTNSSGVHGSVPLAPVKTDAAGVARFDYHPTGLHGLDVVTAFHPCLTTADNPISESAELTLRIHALDASITGPDCLGTHKAGVGAPQTGFSARVVDPSGLPLAQFPLTLNLGFDPAALPDDPNFGKLQGQLFADGQSLGSTSGADGLLGPEIVATGSNEELAGQVALKKDIDELGARLILSVGADNPACVACGTRVDLPVAFYRLTAVTLAPAGCAGPVPCQVPPGSKAPRLQVALSLGERPAAGARLDLALQDLDKPSPAAASSLEPEADWVTDGSGLVEIEVSHNNDPAVSDFLPLKTLVQAASLGANGVCADAAISAVGSTPQLWFEGPLVSGIE